MGKSDEYIDFKAYTCYLRKVTGKPYDAGSLRKEIMGEINRHDRIHAVYVMLRWLAAVVIFLVLFIVVFLSVFRHAF